MLCHKLAATKASPKPLVGSSAKFLAHTFEENCTTPMPYSRSVFSLTKHSQPDKKTRLGELGGGKAITLVRDDIQLLAWSTGAGGPLRACPRHPLRGARVAARTALAEGEAERRSAGRLVKVFMWLGVVGSRVRRGGVGAWPLVRVVRGGRWRARPDERARDGRGAASDKREGEASSRLRFRWRGCADASGDGVESISDSPREWSIRRPWLCRLTHGRARFEALM